MSDEFTEGIVNVPKNAMHYKHPENRSPAKSIIITKSNMRYISPIGPQRLLHFEFAKSLLLKKSIPNSAIVTSKDVKRIVKPSFIKPAINLSKALMRLCRRCIITI